MLKNISIVGKTLDQLYSNQAKDWDAQRDAARKEISRWSFDDLMFHLPSDKKAMILTATTGEANMQQKWQQIV